MKEEEEQYLELEKGNNGKSREQAREEIRILKLSQINFKDLNKEIRHLKKELTEKDKIIGKLQKSNFKGLSIVPRAEKKIEEIKNSKNDDVTLKELNRIITIIEVEKQIGLNDLGKATVLKPKKVKGALNFLVRNKFVKEVDIGKKLMLEKI